MKDRLLKLLLVIISFFFAFDLMTINDNQSKIKEVQASDIVFNVDYGILHNGDIISIVDHIESYFPSDDKRYKFTILEAGEIQIDFSHEYTECYWNFQLYSYDILNNEGNHWNGVNSYYSLDEPEVDSIRGIYLDAGSYYIKMSKPLYNGSSMDYNLKISFSQKDYCEKENNSSNEYANLIIKNQEYTANLSDRNDEDYFKFENNYLATYTINFSHPYVDDSSTLWYLYLYKNENDKLSKISSSSIKGNVTEYNIVSENLEVGEYYIRIYAPSYGSYGNDDYKIKITEEHTHVYNGYNKYSDTQHFKECIFCEYKIYEKHVWDSGTIITKKTCTTEGLMKYTCIKCKHTKEEVILPSHEIINVIEKEATCEEKGNSNYSYCSVCNEIFGECIISDALGHNYGEWYVTKEPTEQDSGELSRICNNDENHIETYEIPVLSIETYNYSVITEPTCEIKGVERYTLEKDGQIFYFDVEIKELGHNYNYEIISPTCEEDGYIKYTCHCGYSYNSDYVYALGHSYGAWEVVTNPTCENDGLEHRICHCGHEETRVIDAHGHDYVWNEGVNATCIEDGVVGHYHCETCGANFDSNYNKLDSIVIPSHGHNYTIEVTEPTCEEQGYTTYTCEHCSDNYKDNYVEELGHTYSDWNEEVSATCIEDGVVGHYHCEVCGANFDSNYIKLDSIVIPAHGHNYTTEITEPTCEEQGYTTYTCEHCSDTYISDYVEATGHTYGDWEVVTNPTCENDGQEHRVCHCGHEETRVIKAHGHSYVWNEEVSATCLEDGIVGHYHCETCGANFDSNYIKLDSIVIPAHGHNYTTEITEPTCEEQGYTTYTCEHCGDTYIGDYVEALGHDMIVDQDGNSSCSRCDYQFHNEQKNYTTAVIVAGSIVGVGGLLSLLRILIRRKRFIK